MRIALARHDEILREAIETRGGYVFKTVGDAFCSCLHHRPGRLWRLPLLPSMSSASEDWWRRSAPLRVRMALHTGAAEERDGDYFGPPL